METERRETGTLIGSDKVEGTAVYGSDAQKIGSIERVIHFCRAIQHGDHHAEWRVRPRLFR
ncbi:hypothetical protein ABIF68_009047 [Bradyrhizobium japonicum]